MDKMFRFIAHSGEVNEMVVESTTHWLENWVVALPLFLLSVASISLAVYFLFKKSVKNAYFAAVGSLLGSGIFLYDKSPLISAIAISLGLFGSLLVVLAALSSPVEKQE